MYKVDWHDTGTGTGPRTGRQAGRHAGLETVKRLTLAPLDLHSVVDESSQVSVVYVVFISSAVQSSRQGKGREGI